MLNTPPVSSLIYSSDSSLHPSLALPLGQEKVLSLQRGRVVLVQGMGSNDAAFTCRGTVFAFKEDETEADGIEGRDGG